MFFKSEKGIVGTDIAISVIIITIFIAIIGNLIVNINLNSKDVERKTIATSYAIQEIEKFKAQGYIQDYNGKGIDKEELIEENDIMKVKDKTDESNFDDAEKIFSGYHKKVTIKDYVLIKNDSSKQEDLLKEIIVEISYRLGNKNKSISLSTYVTNK